jgi:hypothetical protein
MLILFFAYILLNIFVYILSRFLYNYLHPMSGADAMRVEVKAASHFHSGWRWWSDTWVTGFWLHSFFQCLFWFDLQFFSAVSLIHSTQTEAWTLKDLRQAMLSANHHVYFRVKLCHDRSCRPLPLPYWHLLCPSWINDILLLQGASVRRASVKCLRVIYIMT